VFATRARFPEADEVVVDWPDRLLGRVGPSLTARDAVCVLTHDAKFDVPALVAALETGAGYIGAMGSRRTHAERLVRLREALSGAASADLVDHLDRIRAPIGLDIGARTPEETAVSICAEIIADRTGRSADVRPLRTTTGPIHRPSTTPSTTAAPAS
jgi:xanthine dehydrogenase accessory factor